MENLEHWNIWKNGKFGKKAKGQNWEIGKNGNELFYNEIACN
jgi:hypothetical protein